jgi:hypothetical protein
MVAQGHSSRSRTSIGAGIRDQAAQQAMIIAQQLRQRGDQYLDEKKQRAAENLSAIGAAIRRAAEKLADTENQAMAQYVSAAADGVEGVSRYVQEQDIEQLAKEIARAVQRKPALVLGGLFLAGLTVGRFTKATSPARARAAAAKRNS